MLLTAATSILAVYPASPKPQSKHHRHVSPSFTSPGLLADSIFLRSGLSAEASRTPRKDRRRSPSRSRAHRLVLLEQRHSAHSSSGTAETSSVRLPRLPSSLLSSTDNAVCVSRTSRNARPLAASPATAVFPVVLDDSCTVGFDERVKRSDKGAGGKKG